MFHKIKAEVDEFEWSVDGNLVFAKDKVKKNFTFMIPPQLGLDRKNYTKEFKADEIMYGFQSKHSVTKMDLFHLTRDRSSSEPFRSIYARYHREGCDDSMGDGLGNQRIVRGLVQKEMERTLALVFSGPQLGKRK